MRNPQNFDKVINKAFAIAAGVSFVAGAAGYLMIGNTVSDEVSWFGQLVRVETW
jgi:vesicular inhibitory amino acid transporter